MFDGTAGQIRLSNEVDMAADETNATVESDTCSTQSAATPPPVPVQTELSLRYNIYTCHEILPLLRLMLEMSSINVSYV